MPKNGFWCENCGAKSIGTEAGAIIHLISEHDLNIIANSIVASSIANVWFSIYNLIPKLENEKTFTVQCRMCNQTFIFRKDIGYCELYHNADVERHRKKHQKYMIDKKEFRNIRLLLHYIDVKYNVHVGYVRGITNKRVFMDGITKMPSKKSGF